MNPVSRLLLKAAAVGAWASWCKDHQVDPWPDEQHFATTRDGWRISVARYLPRGGKRRQHPVLLCPGLSANRIGFDLAPEVSLARHLAGRGYDTWCVELRGHGKSDAPSLLSGKRYGWSFDDYLERDLPVALERVLKEAGAKRCLYLGHSMGGLLLYSYLATGGRAIRAGIAVGSSLDYSVGESDFHQLAQLLPLTRLLPAIPFGPVAFWATPLTGRFPNRLEEFNVWPANVEPYLARRLNASTFHPVSSPVLAQLASGIQKGGLRSRDGRVRYSDGLGKVTTPVLAIAGDRDRQCPPATAKATLEALGARGKALQVFGREQGHASHYGHFDLLIGRRAAREVWPKIDAWLDEHD